MAHYEKSFDLNESDIELIEDTVRNEIRTLTQEKQSSMEHAVDTAIALDTKIRRLNMLLGKLHNQKIWYSQVNQTGVPLG